MKIRIATEDALTQFRNNPIPSTFRHFGHHSVKECLADHTLTILAYSENEPVGYAHIDNAWIGICVLPQHQGRGIGKALLQFLIDYARGSENTLLRLTVDTTNEPAISMYRTFGFEIVSEVQSSYLMSKVL